MLIKTGKVYMLACEGEEGGRIARMEETIARALSVRHLPSGSWLPFSCTFQ